MPKQQFTDLDPDTQTAVLANMSIPHMEQAITGAAASADQEGLTRLTNEYNRMRGLPVADTATTGTADTPDDDTTEDYKGWKRDALEEEAVNERDLNVTGTGRDGYVTNQNYRDALVADDRDDAAQDRRAQEAVS